MSNEVGTVEGVAVSTFAAGAGRGQKVQLTLPGESSFTTLHPESAEVLARMLMTAAQRTKAGTSAGRVEVGATRNADRRAKMYHYYEAACRYAGTDGTLPEARDAVRELRAIALGDVSPSQGVPHLNPRITRRNALEALAWLALDGWGIGPIDDPAYIHPPDLTLFVAEARSMDEVFLTATHDDRVLDA